MAISAWENSLQLYNAVNNTSYENADEIEVNTLEDVVYMGMKNDISFFITDVLNLYEHQSIFSPKIEWAFLSRYDKENVAIQCRAIVLNVNLGYNMCIMEKCKKLKEYSQFIARVRKYLEEYDDIEMAVDRAIEECIKEGILEQILGDNCRGRNIY